MIALRPSAPVHLGDDVIIAVERVRIVGSNRGAGRWIAADKRPLAVCVVDGDGVRAFDIDGSDVSIAWLCDRVPGLESAVAAAVRSAEIRR